MNHANSNQPNPMSKQVHVASWLAYALTWMILLWSFPSVEMLLFSFFCLIIWMMRTETLLLFLKQLRWIAPILLIIILIQLALSRDGMIVLWQFNWQPSLFDWQIQLQYRLTQEALVFACKSALQYVMVLGIWLVFSNMLPSKKVFAFGSKWFPHLMQMFYITIRLIPHLRLRARAIQDVLETRGFQNSGHKTKIRQKLTEKMPLMNALLEESLEGSWHRAEAMMLRGYGNSNYKRSFYVEDFWTWRDGVIFFCLCACVLSIWSPLFTVGFFAPLFWVARQEGSVHGN